MTKLHSGAGPVVRETAVQYQGRPLVIECWPHTVIIHRKGTHNDAYAVPWEVVFEVGGKMYARAHAGEPKKARARR